MGGINNRFNQDAGNVEDAALVIKKDKERNTLADKMKYNDMTIMKIGKLTDYILGEDKFYKGQLIRLNIKVDSHMAYEIYNELNKGVYL